MVDRQEEGGGRGKKNIRPSLPTPSLPTFTEIKHDGSANYRWFITLTCAPDACIASQGGGVGLYLLL